MPVGKTLQQAEKRFAAKRDARTGAWRIIDLWHPDLESRELTDDIPDDSPAMTILSEEAFNTIFSEAERLNLLPKLASSQGFDEERERYETQLEDLGKLNDELNEKLARVKDAPQLTEKYRLKKDSIDAILKVIGVDALENEEK